jgi:hypothetical protein
VRRSGPIYGLFWFSCCNCVAANEPKTTDQADPTGMPVLSPSMLHRAATVTLKWWRREATASSDNCGLFLRMTCSKASTMTSMISTNSASGRPTNPQNRGVDHILELRPHARNLFSPLFPVADHWRSATGSPCRRSYMPSTIKERDLVDFNRTSLTFFWSAEAFQAFAFSTLSKAIRIKRAGGVPSNSVILPPRARYFPPCWIVAVLAVGLSVLARCACASTTSAISMTTYTGGLAWA